MRQLVRYLCLMAAIGLITIGWTAPAAAHPLGNFTINHFAGLQVKPDQIAIDYVLDMAEIPAFQEMNQLDVKGNRLNATAATNYATSKCQDMQSHLVLRLDQQPLALTVQGASVEFPPGVGGLATLRLTCDFQSPIAPNQAPRHLEFVDQAYSHRLGWREITVVGEGVAISGEWATTSLTNRLRDYPTELLNSPLNQRQVAFQIQPDGARSFASAVAAPMQPTTRAQNQELSGRRNDAFTRLITLDELNVSTIAGALAIAFLWGGLHALSPGHGKTVVGAYLVGARSKVYHALFLGLTVTLTHTASIFLLGLLLLGTAQFVLTEQIYPWLSVLSGVLVTAIGANLLRDRLRPLPWPHWRSHRWALAEGVLDQQSEPDHGHHHQPPNQHLVSHAHAHSHGADQSHHYRHSHRHGHSHSHSHGHHSHLPPEGTPISWSSLLALGISGGLLPCPSALVVLLSAVAIGRIGFGLALVSAFSLGLAGVLTGIGLLLVYAKHWFERLPLQTPRSQLLPAASAIVMTLIGIGITAQAVVFQIL